MKKLSKLLTLIMVLASLTITMTACNVMDKTTEPYTFGGVTVNIIKDYEIDESDEGGYGIKGRYPYVRFVDPKDNTNNITIFYEEGQFSLDEEEFDLTGYDVEILSSRRFKIDDVDAWLIHSKYEDFDENGTLYFYSLNVYLNDKHTTIQTNTYNSEIDAIMGNIIDEVKIDNTEGESKKDNKVVNTTKPVPTSKPTPTPEPTPSPTPALEGPNLIKSENGYNFYNMEFFAFPVPNDFELVMNEAEGFNKFYIYSDGTAIEMLYIQPIDTRVERLRPFYEVENYTDMLSFRDSYRGEFEVNNFFGDTRIDYDMDYSSITYNYCGTRYNEFRTVFTIDEKYIASHLIVPADIYTDTAEYICQNYYKLNLSKSDYPDVTPEPTPTPDPMQYYEYYDFDGLSVPIPTGFRYIETDDNTETFVSGDYHAYIKIFRDDNPDRSPATENNFIPTADSYSDLTHDYFNQGNNIVKSIISYDDMPSNRKYEYDIIVYFDNYSVNINMTSNHVYTDMLRKIFDYVGEQR